MTTDEEIESFRKLFPGISREAAEKGFGRMMEILQDNPIFTPTKVTLKIFRDVMYQSALRGESWAIEIGESEGWLVQVDSSFRIGEPEDD